MEEMQDNKRKLEESEDSVDPKRMFVDHSIPDAEIPTVDDSGKPILFNGVEVSKLTKTQMKKYKRMLKWEMTKKEKRAKERLKLKNRKEEAKKNNVDLGPTRKQLKQSKMSNSTCKISVVIDLSFDDLMINKDMGKVIKQILRIYTENRRAEAPMQLYLTSFDGRSKEEMAKHNGYQHWDLNFHSESYLDIFPKDKLVYLSSESDNVITELEDDKVYIIGGLVDHNSHKGICYKKAVEQGIMHGQLPIGEYFHMKHRKVFTINQVYEILLRVTEGKSFKEAFESVLPKRINMQPTNAGENEEDDGSGNEESMAENQEKNVEGEGIGSGNGEVKAQDGECGTGNEEEKGQNEDFRVENVEGKGQNEECRTGNKEQKGQNDKCRTGNEQQKARNEECRTDNEKEIRKITENKGEVVDGEGIRSEIGEGKV